jgi:uncharacterized protein
MGLSRYWTSPGLRKARSIVAQWITDLVGEVERSVKERTNDRVAAVFKNCFANTLESTMTPLLDGTIFVFTGDIPAMWLRDSTTQLAPYLHFAAGSSELADLMSAVNRRQLDYILLDPYANAFNAAPNAHGHHNDLTELSPWVWERKYEIDSLCYPIQLAHDLWQTTGRTDHLTGQQFSRAAARIIALWRIEQDHSRSSYRFERIESSASDTLARNGLGPETEPTGMSWSGFRPSDDACRFGFNVPGNAFATTALANIEEIARDVLGDDLLAQDARSLRNEILAGIERHGVVSTEQFGEIFAYEVDGLGGVLLLDDANLPSLLSLPYLGWCAADDPRYVATRAFILSDANPTYVNGIAGRGIGSPHTPPGHIWPIALAIEGLTSIDQLDKRRILNTLVDTDAGTSLMHESFHKDDPTSFTRPWFSWANAMFCELVLDVAGLRSYDRTLVLDIQLQRSSAS